MTHTIGKIPVMQAVELLGLKDVSHIQAKGSRYIKYYIPGKKGTRGTGMFLINECMKDMARDEEFIEKTKLFTEYLKHIEDITYVEMSKKSGVTAQSISTLDYGFKAAIKICKAFENYIQAFDEYYGWN